MYVRADITDAGTGSCFIRARYYDASGTLHTADSRKVKATTSGFERLMVTVTIPSGATSNAVTCSLEFDHVKGTLYGGMAQLEEGATVNRVNLIDNGTFALGNTSGFTGTNTSSIDGVVSASASQRLPVYRGLTCLTAVNLGAMPSSI